MKASIRKVEVLEKFVMSHVHLLPKFHKIWKITHGTFPAIPLYLELWFTVPSIRLRKGLWDIVVKPVVEVGGINTRFLRYPYGKEELKVTVPEENLMAVVEPRDRPGVEDEIAEIAEAVMNPIASKRLVEIAKPGDTVAIVVDDYTRPITARKIVPVLLEELGNAGVRDKDITIVVGLGTHRPCTPEELRSILGEDILGQVDVVNHDMRDRDNLVFIGMTSGGNAVWINRIVAKADVKILTGHIGTIAHGFTGGRKSILPAVAGEDTIYYNHRHEWLVQSKFGQLSGNPMHQDSMEGAYLANVDFIVNVVLNLRHRIVKAVAGDMTLAWLEGVETAKEMYTVEIPHLADIIISSAGGTPKDATLFQSIKAAQVSYPLLNRDGVLILVARCDEGIGDRSLHEWLRMGPKEVLRRVQRGERVHFMADILSSACERAGTVFLKSELPDEIVREIGLEPVNSVEEALKKAFDMVGENAKVLCMPHGPETAPVIKEG